MKELYKPDLRAHVQLDDTNRIRAVRHSDEYWESPESNTKATAIAYLKAFADTYEIPTSKFENLETKVNYMDPREQAESYRSGEEKLQFDAGTFGFYQTQHNIPVWRKGLKVTVKTAPTRVVASVDTSLIGVNAKLPSRNKIETFRKAMQTANLASVNYRAAITNTNLTARAGESEADGEAEAVSTDFMAKLIKPTGDGEATSFKRTRLIRGRFWVYRYDSKNRVKADLHDHPGPEAGTGSALSHATDHNNHDDNIVPFDLGKVPDKIKDGGDYVVAELTFDVITASTKDVWRVLIDVETSSILHVEPMFAHNNGLVFENDPITKTGNTSLDSTSNTATLNPQRDDVVMHNLDAAVGGNLSLTGTWADVGQVVGPDIPPPTVPSTDDFDFDVRTNDFASTSGYFHVDRIFRTIADLGFNVTTYMSNTNFPVPVDIRYADVINARCIGDGMGGIGSVEYGLMDTTDTTNPLGRACDPRVHLHEVLGHGILYEAVDSPNMGFTHSAGDALSLIYFDPDSQCWGVDGTPVNKPGDLRFTYVPWHPTLNRRADRDVADGWAWGGSRDNRSYGSEEILLTTLFSFYRAIGGDHPGLGRRQFASRMAMYLILRTIGGLTPTSDPDYARDFAAEMIATDQLNWTSEGVFGGAYSKVVRWIFEQQGEYQNPLITNGGPGAGSVTTAGNPPSVDVYIDDGRAGGYEFQRVHWRCPNIWNRRNPDGIHTHEEAALGETNYMYCKIKNRGTNQAQNVVVRGYHTKPGAGLNWPADFDPLSTAEIDIGTVNANDTEEILVGPFEWTPNVNTHGHDCVLMVASADGDVANVDNFTASETIPEWRLVPHDNNIGQRNVNLVPGGGGEAGLMAGLDGISFFVGNPNPKRGKMTFDVQVPDFLRKRGWRIMIDSGREELVLKSGARREVFIRVRPGEDFTSEELATVADRAIHIDVLHNDNTVGGMSYQLDPTLAKPYNPRGKGKPGLKPTDRDGKDRDCTKQAQQLADCLGIAQDVDSVCVKEIIVGLKVKPGDCC